MLELILHHTYKLGGQAIDLSRHGSHGFLRDVAFAPNGREPGSGALDFALPTSQVHVVHGPVWDRLGALRVEAWVKLAAHGHRQTIAAGQGAFSFGVRPDGVLEGSFVPPAAPGGPPPPSLRVNSESDSPDGVVRQVPLGAWCRLTYLHDGVGALRLYVDDELVAGAYRVRHPVRGVGAGGVLIGHGLAGDGDTLSGRLDELRIWRYDPRSPERQLSGRPTDERQRDCQREWRDHVSKVLSDPDTKRQFESWVSCTTGVLFDLVRDLRGRGEAVLREQAAFSRQYLELWYRGDLSGPEMESWMRSWFGWLRGTLGPPVLQGFLERFRACCTQHPGLDLVDLSGGLVDCDPELAAYVRLMGVAMNEHDPRLGWSRDWLDEVGGRGPRQDVRQQSPPGRRRDPGRRGGPAGPGQGSSSCGCD